MSFLSSIASGRAHVRVPATSANLGPGYDVLGLALQLYDDVTAEVVPTGVHIKARGEGADQVPRDESHLIVRAMRATFTALDAEAPGLSLECDNHIPHGRGLGSSAAAICAGVLLARQLVPGGVDRMDDVGALALAGRIEGHPDNVAACLLGGVTIAWAGPIGAFRAVRLEPSSELHPVVFIPSFESSTEVARQLLPLSVPHPDAAFNAARAALLVATLTGDLAALLTATEDRLHQPYRAPAMPATAELVAHLRAAGVAAVVSGAGPTVMALCVSPAQTGQALASAPSGWTAFAVAVDRGGAVVSGA
ncbi:MAG: homoserine kinase [Pseudonocardiales bacterium]|nr:homoserine kinase [Pseudonocardiales bacterium]